MRRLQARLGRPGTRRYRVLTFAVRLELGMPFWVGSAQWPRCGRRVAHEEIRIAPFNRQGLAEIMEFLAKYDRDKPGIIPEPRVPDQP